VRGTHHGPFSGERNLQPVAATQVVMDLALP